MILIQTPSTSPEGGVPNGIIVWKMTSTKTLTVSGCQGFGEGKTASTPTVSF